MRTIRKLTTAALAALTLALTMPTAALACGGFFCFTQPVDQSAERILYIQKNDQITVHIQISYTGDDKQFSWVLPLTSLPKLGIGSDSIFQVLEQSTAPRFQLDFENQDGCWAQFNCPMAAAGGRDDGSNGGGGGVKILAQENVGPYNTVVISGNSGTELVKWLTDNGYQQPAESTPLIDQYAKTGYVFLALKLQKDKGAGDLAPIVVTLQETSPCLPLRLTSIAAAPEMPIVAWVLGESRAIPKNFLHVELNEATVDWLKPGNNYKTVVSKAVDQASGHAFTTELAKPTSKVPATFAQKDWSSAKLAGITEPGKMLMAMLEMGLPRTTQLQGIIRKHIAKPKEFEAVSDQEFYSCVQCDGCTGSPCDGIKAAVKAQGFDGKAMADDIQETVIAPLQGMQTSYETSAYITRLYTLVSPPEMNKDPIFAFNKDLPEVDNVHTAKALAICEPGKNQAHAVKITFKSGQEQTIELPNTNDWSFCGFAGPVGFGGAPAFGQGDGDLVASGGQPAYRVEVIDESGLPLEIDPRDADLVDAELSKAVAGKPSLSSEFLATLGKSAWDPTKTTVDPNKPDTTTPTSAASGGGCTAGRTASWGAGWLAALAMLVLVVRRRRNTVG